MFRLRRFLRGSGRVLACVFAASVIWLLFDMAALRMSINDVNSELLRERVIREKQILVMKKQQQQQQKLQPHDQVTRPKRRGFKHPLHKVTQTVEIQQTPKIRLEQVYRHMLDPKLEVKQSNLRQEGRVLGSDGLKSALSDQSKRGGLFKKEAVNLDLDVAPANGTQPKKGSAQFAHESLHMESKTGKEVGEEEPVETGVKESQIDARPVNRISQQKHGKDANRKEDPRPQSNLRAGGNSSAARRPSVHRVIALDATHAPRDRNAVGQFGSPVILPGSENAEVMKRWNEGHFNVYLSDQIPVDRAIPDTRPETCAQDLVHDDLPTTTVIFCFVDEVWSTLLRSVHSVLNRSPPHLLKEVILVDDASTKDYLKEPLDEYMSQFPKVQIIRLKERQGLIRARLAGAAVAKGEVLTFLDSHIECNVGWLEPLLERIYLDRKKVPCPVIEVINDKDMSYLLVDNFQRGIFKWPLVFGWSPVSEDVIKKNNMKVTDPIRCPVMAGGLFSIEKKYFFELGAYDPGLNVWGGENMEISFKIWMCGGEIEIIPCSRVGHIFRGQNPYKFPKDRQKTVERNLARVAEVWLDEYKDVFYGHGYQHLLDKRITDIGNLTDQIELRKKLKCKSFKWYLDNVFPDMNTPVVKAEGLIFNRGLRKCLALRKNLLTFQICDLSNQNQHFNYTWMRNIQHHDLCVAAQNTGRGFALLPCDNSKRELRWFYKNSNSALPEHLISEFVSNHMCLEAEPQDDSVRLRPCQPSSVFQKWEFTRYHV